MKWFHRILGLLVLVGLTNQPHSCHAGTVRILFQDAQTGAAVKPARLLFNGVDITGEVAGNALVREVPDGKHQVEVVAEGYTRLSSTVTSAGTQTLANVISLDRSTANAVPTPEVKQDEFVISGHVLNEESSEAVPDAEVRVEGFPSRQKSGKDGHFSITISLQNTAATTTGTEVRGDLVVTKTGYLTEKKQDLILVPGSSMQTQVSLLEAAPGEEGKTRTESHHRRSRSLSTWVYQIGLD